MGLRDITVTIDTPAQPAVAATIVDGQPVPAKAAKLAGRDHGKVFVITEMDAFKAEWWAIKLTLALGKAGLELPDSGVQGMAAIAAAGLSVLLKLDPKDAKPLHDEMLECAKYRHAPDHPLLSIRDPGIVEDPRTILTLLKAVFKLHMDFS